MQRLFNQFVNQILLTTTLLFDDQGVVLSGHARIRAILITRRQ